MIARIAGTLTALDVEAGRAQIDPGQGLVYEVLLPGYVIVRLSPKVGSPVTLETIHYLEGTSQGSSFTPRLAGFLAEADKAFFELFTTVKGIGARKALRAMSMPPGQLAAAISDRDAKFLQSLPEIGKRTAETIIASLHGKVDRFIDTAPARSTGTDAASEPTVPRTSVAREAIEVLTQLGENRADAVRWVDAIMAKNPDIDDSQDLLTEVFRVKSGS